MSYRQFLTFIEGGAAALASLCSGPQVTACVAAAGVAITVAVAYEIYNALVNADWDAYTAYQDVIAEANSSAIPHISLPIATQPAPGVETVNPELISTPPASEIQVVPTAVSAPLAPDTILPNMPPNVLDVIASSCVTALSTFTSTLVQSQARSRTRNRKTCNPALALQWKQGLQTRSIQDHLISQNPENRLRYQYQYRVTRDYSEYRAVHGIPQIDTILGIWADGIKTSNCRFVDTKRIGSGSSSPFVPGSDFPVDVPNLFSGTLGELAWEIARYKALIENPNIPIIGLEIHTNVQAAQAFFQGILASIPNSEAKFTI